MTLDEARKWVDRARGIAPEFRNATESALIALDEARSAAESHVAAMREAAAKVAEEMYGYIGHGKQLHPTAKKIGDAIRALPLPAPIAPAPEYGTITGSGHPPRPPTCNNPSRHDRLDCSCGYGPTPGPALAFDAEAAFVAGANAADALPDLSPVTNDVLWSLLDTMLAAGRGAK